MAPHILNRKLPIITLFKFANYLLFLTGFFAFAQGDTLPVFLDWLLAGLLIFCCVMEIKGVLPIYTDRKFMEVKLISINLSIYLYIMGVGLFDLASYLLAGYLFFKIIYKKDDTDYLFCYFLSLILMVIGAISSVEFFFVFIFIAFFLNMTWLLILYHLKSEGELEAEMANPSARAKSVLLKNTSRQFMGVPSFTGASLLILVTFFMALFIFFFFPRVNIGFLQFAVKKNRFITSGFGNEVTLGEIGRIQQNGMIAFRSVFTRSGQDVKLEGIPYWRGLSLDFYDGKKWIKSPGPEHALARIKKNSFLNVQPIKNADIVKQEIFMETTTDSNILFLAGSPIRFLGPMFNGIMRDAHQNYKFFPAPSGKYQYTAMMDIRRENRGAYFPVYRKNREQGLKNYLQLPDVSEGFLELAEGLAGTGAPWRQAENIENALKKNYRYSLEMTYEDSMAPVEYFLFKTQKGHCEYFATAMTLMLRANGIPARITNGFAGGEWNETGKYYIVRERDAHSWVEAYFHGEGWKAFDPTPPARFTGLDSWMSSRLLRYIDFAKLAWNRRIINYSQDDQAQIIRNLRTKEYALINKIKWGFYSMKMEIKSFVNNVPLGPLWIILAIGVLFFLIQVLVKYFPGKRKEKRYASREGAILFYRKVLERMEKKGFRKLDSETAVEYSQRMEKQQVNGHENLEKITGLYNKVRFGEKRLSEEERRVIAGVIT